MAYFNRYIIVEGDTLQSIAQRELGDISRWTELAESNNLEYPFITPNPLDTQNNPEHLVTYGDEIVLPTHIPDLQRLTTNDFNQYQRKEIYDLSLGMDISMVIDSDDISVDHQMYMEESSDTGDFKSVVGIDNLRQSLQLRLMTQQGSLLLHPEYGSRVLNYLGAELTPDSIDLLQDEILRTINTDYRVSNSSITKLEVSGGNIKVYATVQPIDEKEAFTLFITKVGEGEINVL